MIYVDFEQFSSLVYSNNNNEGIYIAFSQLLSWTKRFTIIITPTDPKDPLEYILKPAAC